jgi:hypothetical protein
LSKVTVSVPSDGSAPALVDSIVLAFGETGGLSADDTQALRALTEGFVRFTLEHAYPDQPWEEIEVTLDAADGLGQVDVHDWGSRSRLPAEMSARCRLRWPLWARRPRSFG